MSADPMRGDRARRPRGRRARATGRGDSRRAGRRSWWSRSGSRPPARRVARRSPWPSSGAQTRQRRGHRHRRARRRDGRPARLAMASTTELLVRRDGVQTSASVLPIRPDGSRPAFHVVGANATYSAADAPWDAIAAATHLHLGAPEFMGGEEAAKILSFAREHGVVTSADLLAPGEQARAIRRLDRARARAPRLPAPQRGAGARADRRG